MEHMECFLSSLPQTFPLIRAVEVSLSVPSPTADFTCTSRSFLQGKLQNLAKLQKVLRHRKQARQLWLSGSCLVLHIITIWHFYLKKLLMFLSDYIFSIKNPWPVWQYTNIAKVHGSRNRNTHDKLYCACLMDNFFIPLAREWWVTLWRGVSRSHSARGTLAVWQCEVWFLRPPGVLTGGPRSLCFGGQTFSHGWLD